MSIKPFDGMLQRLLLKEGEAKRKASKEHVDAEELPAGEPGPIQEIMRDIPRRIRGKSTRTVLAATRQAQQQHP